MKKYIKISIYCLATIIIMMALGCTGLNNIFKESEKVDTKNVFSKLLITNTFVDFPEYKKIGIVKGKLTNSSKKVLGGNFKIVFYAANGGINKIYNTPIPESEIKPGESKIFSVKIDKFEYETYDFEDDNIFVKEF